MTLPPLPAAAPPKQAGAVVVGGGVIGVACAYALAVHGADVALVEARRLAAGASGRNGGFVIGSARELDRLRAVLARERIDAGYAEPGHLALASSPAVLERFAAGSSSEILDRDACETLLGRRIGPGFCGGRLQRRAGIIDSGRFVRGLAAAAARRGATVVEDCAALEIDAADGAVRVRTRAGTIEAEHVVVAAGLATATLAGAVAGQLAPARGQMLATVPVPPAFRLGMAVDFGAAYWRQAAGGEIVLGGCRSADPEAEATARDAVNPRVQAALDAFLPGVFPGFAPVRVCRRWAGIMDCTRDGAPLLGRAAAGTNVWVAAGFGGHGIPPALDAGEAIARAIGGRAPAVLDRLGPARFQEVAA
jgi:glycine/D-amino acid oxidase-like deaminating enzyme